MTYSTSPSGGYSYSSTVLPYISAQSSIPPLLTLFGTVAPHTVRLILRARFQNYLKLRSHSKLEY